MLSSLVNREGVVCANVGLETKYIFIQRVENDHLLVFCGGLRETGKMARIVLVPYIPGMFFFNFL